MTSVIFLAVLLAVVTVFVLQNASPVVISFLFWRFEASLAVVIFLSVLSGCLIAAVIGFSRSIKRTFRGKHQP